jgi:DHA1 family inner membrane transport protein
VAQVAGVPLATWLGQHAGWRAAFWVVTGFAGLTLVLVLVLVPKVPADPEASAGREAAALTRSQVWLTALAGAVGFGGMFAVYTYISPAVTHAGGLPSSAVPVFLAAFGLGSVIGTTVAGDLADWSMFRSLLGSSLGMGLSLLLFAVVIPSGWWAITLAFAIPVLGSVLVVNLQMRLMQVAGPAKTLGAALNHSSLNVANALGAWLGGVVIAAGLGYRSPAVVGALLSMGGLAVLTASVALHRRHVSRRTPAVTGGGADAIDADGPRRHPRTPLPRS